MDNLARRVTAMEEMLKTRNKKSACNNSMTDIEMSIDAQYD